MRLTCPNCGAQYEVPDDVIPQGGRDVQCSNCGDTWFQAHRDQPLPDAEASTDADEWEEVPAAEDARTEQQDTAPQDVDPAPAAAKSPAPASERQDTPERPERREIDPEVASVLREEAEREKRARARAQGGIETQPDLGLEDERDADRHAREARARMARLRGESDSADTVPASQDIDPTSRRGLFPDIEEINSSLAPGADPKSGTAANDPYPEAPEPQRGGFRRGFLLMLLVAVIALLIYIFAPQLSDTFPALDDLLADYVVWVDGLRGWLDSQIAALMLWLDGMASTAPALAPDATGN